LKNFNYWSFFLRVNFYNSSTPNLKYPSIRTPSLLRKSLSISNYLCPFKRVSTPIRRNLFTKDDGNFTADLQNVSLMSLDASIGKIEVRRWYRQSISKCFFFVKSQCQSPFPLSLESWHLLKVDRVFISFMWIIWSNRPRYWCTVLQYWYYQYCEYYNTGNTSIVNITILVIPVSRPVASYYPNFLFGR
jgi:hypothetical protein